jgi:hypothetical protein
MNLKARIVTNIHIYIVDGSIYISPTRKDEQGIWVETLPVFKVTKDEKFLLLQSLTLAHQAAITNKNVDNWNGEEGYVWQNSKKLFTLCWYDDKSVKVTPYTRELNSGEPADENSYVKWKGMPDKSQKFHFPVDYQDLADWLLKNNKG